MMPREFMLIDGPLVVVGNRRKAIVLAMAAELVRFDAFQCEGSASRTLHNRGYRASDIFMMIDDARQVAMQSVVAEEMGKP